MKQRDWIIHAVCDPTFKDGLCDAHTHGMEVYNHLNFQMVLLCEQNTIAFILNTLCDRVASGEKFNDGDYVSGIFSDCKIQLKEFSDCDGEPVLRVMIPDEHNYFPDDFRCSPEFKDQLLETQKLITT